MKRFIIVDANTGEMLTDKIYTYEGGAKLKIMRSKFSSHKEPMVICLDPSLTLLIADIQSSKSK